MKYDKNFLEKLYTEMFRIREFETKAAYCFSKSMLAGNIHLCIGQEPVAVGAMNAIKESDYITSTHRGHGHCIAKGAKTDRMMAELFGKKTGYCKGKGGSMHIVDVSLGILGANGIVGGGIPLATGSALYSKIKDSNDVTLCFFGDGASNEGFFHEAINMGATWKLPVVYICENNEYGVSVEIHRITNTKDISVRAKAYDIPGKTINGSDVLEVYETVKDAVEYARCGNGPSLIECKTFRQQGHYCGDPASYRPKEYLEEAIKKDGVVNFRKYLLDNEISEKDIVKIENEIVEEIEKAYEFANNSEYPDKSEIITDVYSSDNERSVLV